MPGARTLAFCVSQRHADFMSGWFNGEGLRTAAVQLPPARAQTSPARAPYPSPSPKGPSPKG